MRQEYYPGTWCYLFYQPANRQQIDVAQYHPVVFKTRLHHFFYKLQLMNAITFEVFGGEIQIIKSILPFVIHAANLQQAIFFNTFLI